MLIVLSQNPIRVFAKLTRVALATVFCCQGYEVTRGLAQAGEIGIKGSPIRIKPALGSNLALVRSCEGNRGKGSSLPMTHSS